MYLKCPACANNLTPYADDVSKLVVDNCFYCGGIWFDQNEIRKLFTSPKLRKKFLFPSNTFRVKIKDAPEVRACCRCSERSLEEVKTGDVVVDVCRECEGVWLDAREIIRLVELYDDGKLKNKSQVVNEIRWGRFDQTALGQVARMILLALRKLLHL